MTTTVAGDTRSAGLEYRISLERLEELNRSAFPLLLSRLNTACPSFGKTPADISDPADLLEEIRRHCRDDDNFIQSSMPLQEIVFRTLLLNGGEPISLVDLHTELTDRWSSPIRPITVTLSGLARVLDSDTFYGFATVPTDEPELPMLGVGDTRGSGPVNETAPASSDDVGMDDDEDEELFDDDDDEDLFDDDDDIEDE